MIFVVGYDFNDEGEYVPQMSEKIGDRDSLSLHQDEIELLRSIGPINSKSVVVIIGGSPIMMEEWKDNIPSILMAWYCGMEGGNAIARILFGEVNPSGKLPVTIPQDENNHIGGHQHTLEDIAPAKTLGKYRQKTEGRCKINVLG